MRKRVAWPEGRPFALTVVDDADHATEARVRPLYEGLRRAGLRTTKTVWVDPCPEDPQWSDGETLATPSYLDFVRELSEAGFEIALHGVRGTSSTRTQIKSAFDRYHELLGTWPRLHANHSRNADNLYWGAERASALRRLLRLHGPLSPPSFGHCRGSSYFWGDLAREHICYVRALCFEDVNTLRMDPFLPYRERRFPFVNAWFSCSNGAGAEPFVRLLSDENLDRLQREGGLSIVYTHFGTPGFLGDAGCLAPRIQRIFDSLAERGGWVRPASEILDYLARDGVPSIGPLARLRLALAARRSRQ